MAINSLLKHNIVVVSIFYFINTCFDVYFIAKLDLHNISEHLMHIQHFLNKIIIHFDIRKRTFQLEMQHWRMLQHKGRNS